MNSDIVRQEEFDRYRMGLASKSINGMFDHIKRELGYGADDPGPEFKLKIDKDYDKETMQRRYWIVFKSEVSAEIKKRFEEKGPFAIYVLP